jgi:hypothetical protein
VNKLLTIKILAAAALVGVAAENALSEEATPGVSAAPAGQTAAPGTGDAPGWYPPAPDRRGYTQPWPQPSQWPAPPAGYDRSRPYYPPYGQYRPAPAVPAENPLITELEQAQDKLAAKTAELETLKAQMSKLQADFEAATAALQKAQSDTLNAGRQVDTSMAEVDTLKHILCELAARLETRNAALQTALQQTAAKPDDPDSATEDETETETAEQAAPQTGRKCSQLSQYPAVTSGQRGETIKTGQK